MKVPQLPWQVAARPFVQTIIGHSQGVAWPLQADGWQWAGDTGVSAASATSAKLTVDIFETIDAQVFAERELSPSEHGQLQLVTIGETGPQCYAAVHIPTETWEPNQGTPFCSHCEALQQQRHGTLGMCHFCRGVQWCSARPEMLPVV